MREARGELAELEARQEVMWRQLMYFIAVLLRKLSDAF